jgi:hypothetical protein
MLAMRSSVRYLDFRPPPANKARGAGALPVNCPDAAAELAAQIEAARRAARTLSLRTAMLLRSWMSEHG